MSLRSHLTLIVLLVSATLASSADLPETVSFNAQIRPIMSNTCFACHGPDAKGKRIRLDSFEAATGALISDKTRKGIVPGDPAKSEVYRRIIGTSDGDTMPPNEFRHQLTAHDKSLIEKWIQQGAKYEKHWAFTPLIRPMLPKTAKHPIDAYVLERLEQEKIKASPEAEKRTLLRRLSFDLIGLPPTTEEMKAFLDDTRPEAYTKQVDRLLKSERYGERMASQWLDLVRFSDTVGFHGDQNQNIYPYRDYVIDSFNRNQPFDQFTREQLAGDLLKNPTPEQLVATGLLRMNMMTREGGAQPEEYLAKYTADRVRLIGTAWLGATTGCCECHNHKFDPFTIKDFYSLGAFFDDVRQWGVYANYDYTPNKELEKFGNDHPFPPEMRLKSASTMAALLSREHEAEVLIGAGVPAETRNSEAYKTWLTGIRSWIAVHPDGWQPASSVTASSNKKTPAQELDDASALFTGPPQKDDELSINTKFLTTLPINALRLEVLPDLANNGSVGRDPDGRFSLVLSLFKHKDGEKDQPLTIAWSQADRQRPSKYVRGHIPAYLDSAWQSGPEVWQLPKDEAKLPHTAVYHLEQPLTLEPGETLVVKLASANVGRVRVSVSPLVRSVAGLPAVQNSLAKALQSAPESNPAASAYFLATVPKTKYPALVKELLEAIGNLHSGHTLTMVAEALPKEKHRISRVLPRGNWLDKTGEIVKPGLPTFLVKTQGDRTLTRLDLAEWLTSKDNPTTARHWVNFTWKQFFGRGLSSKLDDLGSQGDWPSHPLLLDWLASEFVESGWDRKQIVRLIVTSATYKQSAVQRKDLMDRDPDNRLLAQQTPRRLEAEAIRDNALAVAGLLSMEFIGGPSVLPYQPAGHWSVITFPNRPYVPSSGSEQYRRGLYQHWQRSFLHPMLTNFDAPQRDECTADRPVSNSPQQALTLLNDPTFVEAAVALSDQVLASDPQMPPEKFIAGCMERVVNRLPTDDESKRLVELASRQVEYFTQHPAEVEALLKKLQYKPTTKVDAAKLAGWAQIARVMLNLHETITRY
jgi:hypothetical protein